MDQTQEPQYAAYITAYNEFMRPALNAALDAFAPEPGSRGLDAGCGPGDLFEIFSRMTGDGGEVVCVDLSRAHLQEAARQAANLPAIKVHPHPVDLTEPLGFADNSFDWVWCADVLWPSAFADPQAAVAEFARITRPGGKVAIFCNGWQRTALLPGHRHLEFDLIKASDTLLRPPKSNDPRTDIEYVSSWMRQAGMSRIDLTAHTVSYAHPLPAQARPYLDCVLREDYQPALALMEGMSAREKERVRSLLSPGSPDYLPDQDHYFCVKTGVLTIGRVE